MLYYLATQCCVRALCANIFWQSCVVTAEMGSQNNKKSKQFCTISLRFLLFTAHSSPVTLTHSNLLFELSEAIPTKAFLFCFVYAGFPLQVLVSTHVHALHFRETNLHIRSCFFTFLDAFERISRLSCGLRCRACTYLWLSCWVVLMSQSTLVATTETLRMLRKGIINIELFVFVSHSADMQSVLSSCKGNLFWEFLHMETNIQKMKALDADGAHLFSDKTFFFLTRCIMPTFKHPNVHLYISS